MNTVLTLHQISKSFPGIKVLDNISLDVTAGEVHALCGENGAGKSTLMNIISGNIKPDDGIMRWRGVALNLQSPHDAFATGISIVHQHLSLVDNLSIAENIFANIHPTNKFGLIDYRKLHQQTVDILQFIKIDLVPQAKANTLSLAEKQIIEIAKALVKKPQLLILDEPTATLTDPETRVLFEIINFLKKDNVSILYISHRLSEIFEIADRVSVLKDGKYQGTFERSGLTKNFLINKMVGRDLVAHAPTAHSSSTPIFEVKNFTGKRFTNINFNLHAGEIIGLSGLVGAGRTEIARAIFGIDKKISGSVLIDNKPLNIQQPQDAIAHDIAYVPEDRKVLGIFANMSIIENIAVAADNNSRHWLINRKQSKDNALHYMLSLNVIAKHITQPVQQLSGGNQQKVLLARWLSTNPKILIIDEPTLGVDIGAKQQIYDILKQLSCQGMGIIIISSELPELLAMCNRILVIRDGQLSGALSSAEASEEKILALAT